MELTKLFREFFQSERIGGYILLFVTVLSLILANVLIGSNFTELFHTKIGISNDFVDLKLSVEHWINDGMMTIFFLMVGLEIEREIYVGELSSFKNALLPIIAAIGGMVLPALIHYSLNADLPTKTGFGIPMATDIAFALGILSLAGNKVPASLKIFLTALAIIDDLGAITVIAIFYTQDLSFTYLSVALVVFGVLFILGKKGVQSMIVYVLGGLIMWYCMLQSGVHATIAGVLLAFAIPFDKKDPNNISARLQHFLHKPVAFIILPIFALANTAILLPSDILGSISTPNSLGIMFGLLLGKTIGIFGLCFIAVKAKWAALPDNVTWRLLFGAAILAGIGFTMSIFISLLAFTDPATIIDSKVSILLSSTLAAVFGLIVFRYSKAHDQNTIHSN